MTNINFSYNEKLLTDRRPFFAEGSTFFPTDDLFYSRRIATFDGGLKVAGKQNNTTVGFLSTGARGADCPKHRRAQCPAGPRPVQPRPNRCRGRRAARPALQPDRQTGRLLRLAERPGHSAASRLTMSRRGRAVALADSKDFYQFANSHINGQAALPARLRRHRRRPLSAISATTPKSTGAASRPRSPRPTSTTGAGSRNTTPASSVDTFQYHTGGFFHNDLAAYLRHQHPQRPELRTRLRPGRRNQPDRHHQCH